MTCPSDAQGTAIAGGLTVSRANGTMVQPGGPIGVCETLNVLASVAYLPRVFIFGRSFQIVTGSAFFGGTGAISVSNPNAGSPFDVTPADMATTTVGPAPCGETLLKAMNILSYTPTAADIAAGSVMFNFNYTGGHSLLGDCSLLVSAGAQFSVRIVGPPACSLTPATQTVCAGAPAIFRASSIGPEAGAPVTFNWIGPNGFTASGPTITINNAQAANAGIYTATITDQFGCSSTCQATLVVNPNCTACTITGVTISDTAWNKFNIPTGTSPVVWVNMHIGKPAGLSTTAITKVQFAGVTLTLNGTSYALPDGVLIFDPSAPATITTTFTGTQWLTTINPNDLSDEIFFTGAAIPVTAGIAAGGKATVSYTVQTSAPGLSVSWQWSAGVYTYWPADWNQAEIQPYHSAAHAGTPLNRTVQTSLIQGPRGGGGSNFTGSWSATGTAACP
jgi:hypothetical protein